MAELLARVEAATGPDRELDALILCALAAPAGSYVEQSSINGAWCIYEPPAGPYKSRLWEKRDWHRPDGWPLTASVDVILALIGRVLPEANCVGYDGTPKGCDAYVSRNFTSEGHWYFGGQAKTPARALCAALLKALIARAVS